MDMPSQPPASSAPDVLVLTRVVAAGVVEHTNGESGAKEKYLRASVCLLPAPDPDPCNGPAASANGNLNRDPSTWGASVFSNTALKVSLQNWPQEIENILKNGKVTLAVLPVAKTSIDGSILPSSSDAKVATEWTRVIPSRPQTIDGVNQLWQRLIAPTTNRKDNGIGASSRDILNDGRYVSATEAFDDPWTQLKIALAQSLASTVAQSIVPSPPGGAAAASAVPAPNVMAVPHAKAAKALSALRAHASIKTVYVNDQSRHAAAEHAIFRPALANVSPASSKLGLLASGITATQLREARQPKSWQSEAVLQATQRTTLLGAFVDTDNADILLDPNKSENNSNQSIASNIQFFLKRRTGALSRDAIAPAPSAPGPNAGAPAAPPSPHWLGQQRQKTQWQYSDIENEFDKAKLAAAANKPTTAEILENLNAIFTRQLSDTLLQHHIALRPVPYKFKEEWQNQSINKHTKGEEQTKANADLRQKDQVARQIADAAGRRYFGLQSFPTLARLFNFTIDVEIPLEQFNAAIGAWSGTILDVDDPNAVDFPVKDIDATGNGPTVGGQTAKYLLLGHVFAPTGQPAASPLIWSTAKLRDQQNGHFWPVTCEEIEVMRAPSDGAAFAQFDGIVDLGFQAQNVNSPRFELTNLDVVQGLEQYSNSCEGHQSASDGGAPVNRPGQGTGSTRTAGIVVIDTMRRDGVASDASKSTARHQVQKQQTPGLTLLDANDLTIGYRVDVGVKPKASAANHRFVWRTLMNRLVAYEEASADLDELIGQLKLRKEQRIRLDSAMVRTPSQLVTVNDPNAPDSSNAQAIANESVVSWTGDPLGIECAGDAKDIEVDPARDLPMSITYDLPHNVPTGGDMDDESYTPPWLELGRGYRLGMRAVYLGGVTLPLERAAARYEDTRSGTLTLPAKGSSGHRFLRQEPIDSPLITIAEQVLDTKRNQDMPWDSTSAAVVRTGSDKRLGPNTTWRVIVPPAVPMSFAVLHRLKHWTRTLDYGGKRRLVDGLVNVELNKEIGGFPALNDKRTETQTNTKNQVYDAVFRVGATSDSELASRKQPYFPDPAAKQLVIEVVPRITGAPAKETIIIELTDPAAGIDYPDYLPVLLEVVALDEAGVAKRKGILRHESALDDGVLHAGGAFTTLPLSHWRQGQGTARVRRVVVQLGPGEDYDIRTWFAPTPDDAARWFEAFDAVIKNLRLIGNSAKKINQAATPVVETMSHALGIDKSTAPADGDILEGLAALVGADKLTAVSRTLTTKTKPVLQASEITRMDDVSLAVMDHIAAAVSQRAKAVPVPGLSKSRTIQATHAIQIPRLAPCFKSLDGKTTACGSTEQDATAFLAVVRKQFSDSSATPGNAGSTTRSAWISDPNNSDPAAWSAKIDGGSDASASDTVFGGRIAIDLDTSSQLTVWASAAVVADDAARARDPRKPLPTSAETTKIYGFAVGDDGTVKFDSQRIELLRTKDLSNEIDPKDTSPDADGRNILDLMFAPQNVVREFERRYIFPSPGASELYLTLEARSRFEHMLVRQNEKGQPEVKLPNPLIAEGAKAAFWLPSSKRPDPIDGKSLLPAFVWTEKSGGKEIERRMVVRIRLRRPWFSSGEGERLGIVLWPPELLDPTKRVAIARNYADGHRYPNFDDSDLGPGGQFITRWGSDPIRRGPVQIGWFMPLEAFRDALPDVSGTRTKALPVRDVLMPIPRGQSNDVNGGGSSTGNNNANQPQSTMNVSLLTYEPKFDVGEECWYVDAEISPLAFAYPFVRLGLVRYQPHAPKEWQVSEPVVEFIQLMPQRNVVVNVEHSAGASSGYPVRIDVYGPGSDLVELYADDQIAAGPNVDSLHRPVLKARVLRPAEGAKAYSGEAQEPIVAEVTATGLDGKLLKWNSASDVNMFEPRRGENGLQWSFRFVLKEDPHVVPHSVLLEEVEWMLPTDPVAEAVRQGKAPGTAIVAETGPRFALKVRIRP
jgi:hypothetical protein